MTNHSDSTTVAEIVNADYRAAEIFEAFGIDFCCGGRRTLADACRTAGVDPDAVRRALAALPPARSGADEVLDGPLDRLVDHIVSTHHAYVRTALPAIARHLAKLVEVHGPRHPELTRVAAYFSQLDAELSQHLLKEEQVLFPYIRELVVAKSGAPFDSPFGTIENPIRMMEREHRDAADAMVVIRELTNRYTPPEDGCATYRLTMKELADFERDLHRHVHLENHVLFPRAIALERGELSDPVRGNARAGANSAS